MSVSIRKFHGGIDVEDKINSLPFYFFPTPEFLIGNGKFLKIRALVWELEFLVEVDRYIQGNIKVLSLSCKIVKSPFYLSESIEKH